MATSSVFVHAAVKLMWAKLHLNDLDAFWQRFLETDFCQIVAEHNDEGGEQCRVVTTPLPANVALYVGDIVHNTKSALDYTVNQILGYSHKRADFPFSETRDSLRDSFRTEPVVIDGKTKKAGANAALERAVPGIGAFITDRIGAHAGCPLWALNRLDNRDKHRLIVIAYSANSICDIKTIDNYGFSFQVGKVSVIDGNAVGLWQTNYRNGMKIVSQGKQPPKSSLTSPK